jgi:peptide/nickel transport system substrate-binding protein
MHLRKRRSTLLATFTAFTLLAGACAGDDDDDSGPVTSGSGPAGDAAASGGGDGTASTATDSASGSSAPSGTGEGGAPDDANRDAGDEGEPVHGGTLVYGIEADTANPWAPYSASISRAGYIPIRSISDTLFSIKEDGEVEGLLVERFEHNEDYTEWTLHIREGITFHDGTPLDGDAVRFNIETFKYSPLSGGALVPLATMTSSGQEVTLTTTGGGWVTLPSYFVSGFHMMSKQWLSSLPDVPHRVEGTPVYDAELAATPANGDPAKPVGLGAFKFESYTPGNGNTFRAVRNPEYWRGPNGITGEELPYLDAIEAVVFVDVESRSNAVRAGQIDVMHTANADTVRQFLDDDSMETISSNKWAEVGYILINMAEGPEIDPEGTNANNPLLTLPCRQALAAAVDLERLKEERGGGLTEVANGPFPPGALGYLEDTGYPRYDVDQARMYMDACLTERETDSIEFQFNTTNDPFNVETNQLVVSMWNEAFGDQVKATITAIEQGQYIGSALFGTYQAQSWQNHGGFEPDHQRLWWHSTSSTPVGQQAINFGRFRDPVIDEALDIAKSDPDVEARRAAAETINRQFGENVYNIWLNHSQWGIISQPYVNGVESAVFPDGTPIVGLAGAGAHQTNHMWCDEGQCE